MELFMLPGCRGRRLSGCLNTENKHPRSVGIEGRKKKSVINSYFICRYTNDQNDDCGAVYPERQVIGLKILDVRKYINMSRLMIFKIG